MIMWFAPTNFRLENWNTFQVYGKPGGQRWSGTLMIAALERVFVAVVLAFRRALGTPVEAQ